MTRTEWNTWVEFVKENDPMGMPTLVYEDYTNWECRTTMARILATIFRKYDEAIRIMTTVIEERSRIEKDHLIWALRDIGVWTWNTYKDGQTSLQYLRDALQVAKDASTAELTYSVRGEVWFQYLLLLQKLNRVSEAQREAETKLQEADSKYTYDESYSYYAHLFLAQLHGKKEHWGPAIDHLKPVLAFLTNEYPHIRQPIDAERCENPSRESYEKLLELTNYQPTFYVSSEVE